MVASNELVRFMWIQVKGGAPLSRDIYVVVFHSPQPRHCLLFIIILMGTTTQTYIPTLLVFDNWGGHPRG